MSLFAELKRRNVFRVAAAYLVVGWLLLQVADVLLGNFGAPEWVFKSFAALLALGFPLAIFLAWAFELTPEGLRREADVDRAASIAPRTGRRIDRVIIVGLASVIVLLIAERVWFAGGVSEDSTVPSELETSIAVLPFDSLSADPEQGYFADGLTEEILNSLAALPELLVTARTSSFFYKNKDVPVDEIAERLGVAHILEGSVRRSNDQLRVTAQLIRASDGFHLWSRTYDRSMDDIFSVQTDIANEVAAALGILLDEEKRERMEASGVRDPEAYAVYARGYELFRRAHSGAVQTQLLVEANEFFDEAFERAPRFWVARYYSADLYSHRLLDIADGAEASMLEGVNVAGIRSELETRLRQAASVAPNEAARDFIEISRLFTSENWTGLRQRLERAYGHTEACGFDQWSILGSPFGLAAASRQLSLRATRCNAIDLSVWSEAARAALYDGDAAAALDITQRGLEIAETDGSALAFSRILSLLAAGRNQEAQAALPLLAPSQTIPRMTGQALLAAYTGDSQSLAALRQEMERDPDPALTAPALLFAARGGDRQTANRMAAEIDARPGGPLNLMNVVFQCMCGAPFDLDAAPRLAARLDEAGLAWPPRETMSWPLKDW